MSEREREIARWVEERRQLAESGLNRREVARMGLLTTAGGALVGIAGQPRQALAAGAWPASPAIRRPWLEEMPVPEPVAHEDYRSWGKPVDAAAHQYWSRCPAEEGYTMTARKVQNHVWHPDIPADNSSWGYDGAVPGPTIDCTYGKPFVCRMINGLPDPATYKGWAYPGSITHLHNFHTASESDGGPWRYTLPGEYTDHHYTMRRAGFSEGSAKYGRYWAPDGGEGDDRETLTTLFYHQHMPGYTAANVYKGLFGFCRVFDYRDTGDEEDGSALAWRLPSGRFDVPVVLADKRFGQDGQPYFDPFTTDGFLGDHLSVNGKIKPRFTVQRRKYRFRFLNAGPARFYTITLRTKAGSGLRPPAMVQVTDNGNFLLSPRTVPQSATSGLELWVAERSDVVIDFAGYPDGTEIYLSNILPMRDDGRGAVRGSYLNPDDPANQMLKFVVRGAAAVSNGSRIPSTFREFPTAPRGEAVRTRVFDFGRSNGEWTINGGLWDPDVDHQSASPFSRVQVKKGTAEIWVLNNSSGGWEHPMHIHFEEGQILADNGVAPSLKARKDVYRLGNGSKLEVFLRFRDYPEGNYTYSPPQPVSGDKLRNNVDRGRYVMHCHNVVHEDHAMMTSWSIVP